MAATNETTNYGLPQWESTDKPEMADFNQAMSDIDSNLNLVQPVSGSNTNGAWTKFPDGTMICTKILNIASVDVTNVSGSVFRSSGTTELGSMPFEFVGIPAVSMSLVRANGSQNVWISSNHNATVTNNNFGYLKLASSFGAVITDVIIHIFAIGRWK